MKLDLERVRANVRAATTEDLLDRATVYRDGMEPEALEIIEAELLDRGIDREQIAAHARERSLMIIERPDGTAQACSFCHRPAVVQGWGWHRLWNVVPLFPRFLSYCDQHLPKELDHSEPADAEGEGAD